MTSYWGAVPRTEAVLEVQSLLEGLLPGEGDLLEALHRMQHHYGYVPKEAIPGVAQHLRLPPARVYGAITYYSEFRETPPAETLVSWCSGPACFVKGGLDIKRDPRDPRRLQGRREHAGRQARPPPRPVQRHLRQRAPGLGERQGRRAADAPKTVDLVRELKGETET